MRETPATTAALRALLSTTASTSTASTAPFRVGPGVLRAPPPAVRKPRDPVSVDDDHDGDGGDVDADLLGELTDMVLVGADDAASGRAEVHLQFKAEVFGGLHLRMVKEPAGLVATFVVKDAASRRAVADHVDALVSRLRARGFAVLSHALDVVP